MFISPHVALLAKTLDTPDLNPHDYNLNTLLSSDQVATGFSFHHSFHCGTLPSRADFW